MANPSVRSLTVTTQTATSPRLFTKPTGLTVGDLMVLFVGADGSHPTGLPSGFTQVDQVSSGSWYGTLATKVATSDDVAASSFGVTHAAAHLGGMLYAVKDCGAVDYWLDSVNTSQQYHVLTTGFTPAAANEVLITWSFGSGMSGGAGTDCYTANNNPTWTCDSHDGSYWANESFHASYASSANPGNVTINKGGSQSCIGYVVAIGVYVPTWDDLSVSINSGDASCTSPHVTLTIHADLDGGNPADMCFSNNGGSSWSSWETYAVTKDWELSGQSQTPPETKTVTVKFRGNSVESSTTSDTIQFSDSELVDPAEHTHDCDVLLHCSAYVDADGVYYDPHEMRFSNDDANWGDWTTWATTSDWQMSPQTVYPYQKKTVYAQFRNDDYGVSQSFSDTMWLHVIWTIEVAINGGAAITYSPSVMLSLSATSSSGVVTHMRFSNDNSTWSAWEAYATSKAYTLSGTMPGGVGNRIRYVVYVQFKDDDLNTTEGLDTIIYDEILYKNKYNMPNTHHPVYPVS